MRWAKLVQQKEKVGEGTLVRAGGNRKRRRRVVIFSHILLSNLSLLLSPVDGNIPPPNENFFSTFTFLHEDGGASFTFLNKD
nr:hypothetical protein [Tanacetum cinerariifolium]